jgi:hypothetical protein
VFLKVFVRKMVTTVFYMVIENEIFVRGEFTSNMFINVNNPIIMCPAV